MSAEHLATIQCAPILRSESSRGHRDGEEAKRAPLAEYPVLLLAGGLGTRIRSAFHTGPKSMAPVGDCPFLEYILLWLRRSGVRKVVLCVGYKRSHIQRWFKDGRKWGLQISYCVEKSLLGTAGALRQAKEFVQSECLFALNGDTFLDVNLGEMLGFHRQHKALGSIAVARVPRSNRYGTIVLGAHKRVLAFEEKNSTETGARTRCSYQRINGGVYVLQSEILDMIAPGKVVSLEREVFPLLVGKGLYGFETDGYFVDIGLPDDYFKAQAELPERFSNENPS
jgi:D-glycero-alpha-D-manno-heptose 1-phosphate guanylyltransferase